MGSAYDSGEETPISDTEEELDPFEGSSDYDSEEPLPDVPEGIEEINRIMVEESFSPGLASPRSFGRARSGKHGTHASQKSRISMKSEKVPFNALRFLALALKEKASENRLLKEQEMSKRIEAEERKDL